MRFIFVMQLDIHKIYVLVISVSLMLGRFLYNTQKCSRPIRLHDLKLISSKNFKLKYLENYLTKEVHFRRVSFIGGGSLLDNQSAELVKGTFAENSNIFETN